VTVPGVEPVVPRAAVEPVFAIVADEPVVKIGTGQELDPGQAA